MSEGSDSGKAEFWLYDNSEEPFLAYFGLEDLKADTAGLPSRTIHVIEKSAYDKLASELAKVNSLLSDVKPSLVDAFYYLGKATQIIAVYEKALKLAHPAHPPAPKCLVCDALAEAERLKG